MAFDLALRCHSFPGQVGTKLHAFYCKSDASDATECRQRATPPQALVASSTQC